MLTAQKVWNCMGSKPGDIRARAPERRVTVLLVEDDRAVAAITATWLRALDFDVIVSNDGRTANALASQLGAPIDLLLTDVMLPGMRGPVLAGALRSSHPEMAVLFTSGYSPELVSEIFASHTDTALLLHKPYTADQLACSVGLALGRKAASSNSRPPWPG
jgi:two-component system cell cycle sensor histidine kinase/response regulator CckA